jgi:LPS sulfotransferase NodH
MWDRATTPNGVLSSKLMWNDFDSLRSSLRPPAGTDAGLEFMRTAFPDAQFVFLRREDKVRQGISWWRAAVTDQWALRPGAAAGCALEWSTTPAAEPARAAQRASARRIRPRLCRLVMMSPR